MAISPIDGGAINWEAPNVNQFTLPVPAGTVAGDVIVLTAIVTTIIASNPFTTPANATILVPYATSPSPHDGSSITYLWIAPTTVPSTITVAISTPQQGALTWQRLRGVLTSNPLASTVGVRPFSAGASATGVAPSVTTTHADAFIVGGFSLGSGGSDYVQTPPSGWTVQGLSTRRATAQAYKGAQSAIGATGTASWGIGIDWLEPLVWQVALRPIPGAAAAILLRNVTGAVSTSGFTVSTKTSGTSTLRVKAATNTALTTGVVYGSAATPDADGWAKSTVTGLAASTQYYYGIELTDTAAAVTTTAQVGRARTLAAVGAPTSTRIAWGSCWEPLASPGTGVPSFARILARNPDMFFHCGDFHYKDDGSTSAAVHRGHIESVFSHAQAGGMRDLMAQVPSYRLLSDHDGSDGNDGGAGAWTPSNRAANKQVFPYPTLADPNGLYYSMVSGRVRYIVTDHEYLLAPGTVMGATQKAWFKAQLQQPEPVKVWIQEGAWLKASSEGGDGWVVALAERIELGEFIRTQAVGQVVTIHGGQHAVSADDGGGNPFGGFPVMCAAPFYNWTYEEVTEAGWNRGIYPTDGATASQYGLLDITDTGEQITLAFQGIGTTDTARVTMSVVVPAPSAPVTNAGPKLVIGSTEVTVTWTRVVGGVEVPVTWTRVLDGVEVPLT